MPPGPGSQEVIWTYAPRDCVSPSIRNQLAGYSSSKPASSSRYVAAVKGKPGVSVGRGVAELITAVGSGVGETAACGLHAVRNNKTAVTIKNGCKENLTVGLGVQIIQKRAAGWHLGIGSCQEKSCPMSGT